MSDDKKSNIGPNVYSNRAAGIPVGSVNDLIAGTPNIVSGSLAGATGVQSPFAILRHDVVHATVADRDRALAFQRENVELRAEAEKLRRAIETERNTSAELKKNVIKLENTNAKLQEQQQLAFILERVNPPAQVALLSREDFRKQVLETEQAPMFVMSVDIRRSTELMLKARRPQAFASFITSLCTNLMNVVLEHNGIVDKFTGDGILAFFPEFFSGIDAGYLALAAAERCHSEFAVHYRAHRKSFQSVLLDAGLGIGIDYGECHLVRFAAGLTVVGAPVVYACRLGSAPAGCTYLNQPAYEAVSERHSGLFFLNETCIEIKHEGRVVAYTAKPARTDYQPAEPDWMSQSVETEAQSDSNTSES